MALFLLYHHLPPSIKLPHEPWSLAIASTETLSQLKLADYWRCAFHLSTVARSPPLTSAIRYRTPSPTLRPRAGFAARLPNIDPNIQFEGEPEGANDPPPSSYNVGSLNFSSEILRPSDHFAAATEFAKQVRSTPRTADGTRRDISRQTVTENRKFLTKALGVVPEADPDYVQTKLVAPRTRRFSKKRINRWLQTIAVALGIFDPQTERFILPENPSDEAELYDYVVAIISAIIGEFVAPQGATAERQIMDVHNVKLSHIEGKHKTSPDLVVRATGSSFETPSIGIVGYSNMATFIDVKLDEDITRKAHLEQLAGYSQ